MYEREIYLREETDNLLESFSFLTEAAFHVLLQGSSHQTKI